MFELNYDSFQQHYGNPFEGARGGKYVNVLEELSGIIKERDFFEEHKVFYIQNMFKDDDESNPIIYFFTEKHINKVTITTENISIKTWRLADVAKVELLVPNRYHMRLNITMSDNTKLEFDTENDANASWNKKFKDRLLNIHELLLK